MLDGRKQTRWNLILFLPVHEQKNDEFLGYVADIADQGILLFSAAHIEMGREYAMRIRHEDMEEALVATDIEGDIEFQARSRWVDLDVKPAFHRTGFMFTDPSPDNVNKINQLIRNVAQNLNLE